MLVSVFAFLLGGSGGVATGLFLGSRPHGPTDTPTAAGGFPNAKHSYLHGVTVSAVADDWLTKRKRWKCDLPVTYSGSNKGTKKRIGCEPRDDTRLRLQVNIEYADDDRVHEVNLRCDYGPGDRTCAELFTGLAEVLLAKDNELRKQAVDWARVNVDSDDSTVVGNARLVVSLSPHYLRCTPAS